ncbi:MAG: class I SAM-dependent methyltransferase [candidate division Zixibacteria bacterium]|nr:class I SAM-dependent methyltransferase [candidate division Zixibacteria bacterium]
MKDDYSSYINNFFRKWAPFYDLVNLLIFRIREKVFHLVNPEKGAKILDVCTGTGKQAFAFGKRGFDVMGIDLSEDMLRIAKRKNGYENVEFVIADASNLPSKDNYFDISCISFGLHEMPNSVREKVLKEMSRVTKPQGNIVIVDYAPPKGKIRIFLFYHFVNLYESRYFSEFIKTDLKDLLKKVRLDLRDSCYLFFGHVKISKCEKV